MSMQVSPLPGGHINLTMKATRQLFPYKLYRLLETLMTYEYSATGDEAGVCIAWLQHGRAFIIRSEDVFVSKYAATYFKQTKMRSFTRQLLLWGFKRIIDGPDKGAWHHPHFLRGKPSSLRLVTRTAIKKNTTDRKLAKPEAGPNFYVMPPIEIDTPDAATSALGMNYPPHPRDHGGWLLRVDASTPGGQDNFKIADECGLIADGVLHRTAETSHHPMIALSMASCNYQNAIQPFPALTMQRNSAYMCPNLDSFGQMGQLHQTHNACIPLKSEEQGLKFDEPAYGDQELKRPTISSQGKGQLHQAYNACVSLKSEEQGLKFDEPDNGEKELKQSTISSQLQTTRMVDESSACSETDDLVMKAFQYAFRGLPPRRVSNMNMTEDNGSTQVLPLYQRAHSPMMQRINGNASYTLSSDYYQQGSPVDNNFSFHPISIDRDTSPISDLSNSTTLFEEEVEFGLNKSNFTTYSSSPEPSLNREAKDDFAQFINDTLPTFDDENWV